MNRDHHTTIDLSRAKAYAKKKKKNRSTRRLRQIALARGDEKLQQVAANAFGRYPDLLLLLWYKISHNSRGPFHLFCS